MALKLFRFTPLPQPPDEYEATYFRIFMRTLESYFSQLDSKTPNIAESYTADYVITPGILVAALRPAATMGAGARSFVTDATATTFASVVAGSGANKVPVYSDGTNWRIG